MSSRNRNISLVSEPGSGASRADAPPHRPARAWPMQVRRPPPPGPPASAPNGSGDSWGLRERRGWRRGRGPLRGAGGAGDKPSSVPRGPHARRAAPGGLPPRGDDHPSGTTVARRLVRPTRVQPDEQPGDRERSAPCRVLLRTGFTWPAGLPAAGGLLPHHFTVAGGGPGPPPAVSFLWHSPWGFPRRVLPGVLLCGARTFLDRSRCGRGHLPAARAIVARADGGRGRHSPGEQPGPATRRRSGSPGDRARRKRCR